jgi:ArsR family transcriptional regulator, arsenate/arsenite/antimonite-responsive transcriptional repressor
MTTPATQVAHKPELTRKIWKTSSSIVVVRKHPFPHLPKQLRAVRVTGTARAMKSPVEVHASQFSALGHPARLAILRLVVQGDMSGTPAGELQAQLDVPASTLSHHLKRLSSANLLTSRSEGTHIYYLANFGVLQALTYYLWEDCCGRSKQRSR